MVSDRALVSNVPTSARNWGVRRDRPGAYASEEFLGAAGKASNSPRTSAHSSPGEVTQSAKDILGRTPDTKSEFRAYSLATPTGAGQVGNKEPQVAQTITDKECAHGTSCVGNIVPHQVAQTVLMRRALEASPLCLTQYRKKPDGSGCFK